MDNAFYGMIMPWPANFEPRNWAFCDGRLLAIADNQALFALLGTTYGGDGRINFALPDLRGRTIIGSGYGIGLTPSFRGNMTGYEYIESNNMLAEHSHEMPTAGMSTDLSTAQVDISAEEVDVNLTAEYGLPITSSTSDASSMPNDSEHYLGSPKMPNGSGLNTYYTSSSEPTITTKATTINVSGKVKPTINASLSGSAGVSVSSGLSVLPAGRQDARIPLVQPSLSLNYIICINGLFPSRD